MNIVDRIIADAHAHQFTPQEARWARIEAAGRAVLDAYADPLVQSVGDSPALVELRAALDDPSPEPERVVAEGAHTPGPWTYQRDGRSDAMMGKPGWNPKDPNQCGHNIYGRSRIATLATEYLGNDGGTTEANARLVAAAPDMLAALKRAAPWLGKLIVEGVHEKCVMPNDARRTLDMVENAIARATT